MASNPVTPQPQSGGDGIHDPFTDENSSSQRRGGKLGKEALIDSVRDGEGNEKATSTLFYAYARRSDNHWASRYLLTFASADICKEWWSLIKAEYPDQGERHGPQLFSFNGDDFLRKPATSKKFEHLKTQWFYSQFGDASGTGGRAQEIIPLQDWDGRMIRSGEEVTERVLNKGKGKGKASAPDNDDDELSSSLPVDFNALTESLQSAASIAETTNAQVSQLVESQFHDQNILHQQQVHSQRDAERMQRIEALVEENAAQLQSLAKSHIKAQQQNRELAEQNARVLRELKRQRAQAEKLFEQLLASKSDDDGAGARAKEQGEIEAMHVVVHPPPRKIDRQLVGYAYHVSGPHGSVDGVGAKDGLAKGNMAKRPGAGNRMASSAGPKGVTGN